MAAQTEYRDLYAGPAARALKFKCLKRAGYYTRLQLWL